MVFGLENSAAKHGARHCECVDARDRANGNPARYWRRHAPDLAEISGQCGEARAERFDCFGIWRGQVREQAVEDSFFVVEN